MKARYSTLLIYLFILPQLLAQEVEFSTEKIFEDHNEKYNYTSFDRYEQNTMIKLGAIGGSQNIIGFEGDNFPFDFIAVEHKLDRVSLEATLYFPQENNSAFSMRGRYYLDRVNNLSGRYFAFEYATNTNFRSLEPYLGVDRAIFFQVGRQVKKKKWSYADFRTYVSYQYGLRPDSWNFGFNVTIGPSWGPSGSLVGNLEDESTSWLSSSESLTITLENPILILSEPFDAFAKSISVEREIFKNFTIRTVFSLSLSRQSLIGSDEFYLKASSISISDEIRKYFGPLGKPGRDKLHRSFTGVHLGFGLEDFLQLRSLDYRFSGQEREQFTERGSQRLAPYLAVGYQERPGKRLFYDIYARYSFYSFNSFNDNLRGPSNFSIGTRVGFMWGR